MKEDIYSLFDQIKVTEDMTNYNVCNILLGNIPGTNTDIDPFWLKNRKIISSEKIYENTILGQYFRNNLIKKSIHLPGYHSGVLKMSIEKYIRRNKLSLPVKDEIVMHLRLGDRVAEGHKWNYTDTVNFNYIERLLSLKRPVNKLTIVCNLAFCNTLTGIHSNFINQYELRDNFYIQKSDDVWNLTEESLKLNRKMFNNVIEEIKAHLPKTCMNIFSSGDVDKDICYIYKNGFLGNPKSNWTKMFNYNSF